MKKTTSESITNLKPLTLGELELATGGRRVRARGNRFQPIN